MLLPRPPSCCCPARRRRSSRSCPPPAPASIPRKRNAPAPRPAPTCAGRCEIELVADGRLEATGTITPGTADRFATEIGKRGAYVKTVVLNSPGGSVQDALAMGRLIRERVLPPRSARKPIAPPPARWSSPAARSASPGRAPRSACTRCSPSPRPAPAPIPAWPAPSASRPNASATSSPWASIRACGSTPWRRRRRGCSISRRPS